MNVGLLTTSYPRFPGDYRGLFVSRLKASLEEAGVGVRVIEPRGYGALKAGSGLVANLKHGLLAKIEFPFYCGHFLAVSLLGARNCDILHANWSLSGFFAVLSGRLLGKRVILTERSPLLIETGHPWINRFLKWVMKRCDCLVTISESAKLRLEEKFPELKFNVVPNGVDHEVFSPREKSGLRSSLGLAEGEVHVLSVGRITGIKRLDTLIRAHSSLVRKGFKIHSWVIGDGELRGDLEEMARAEGLPQSMTFLGKRPHEEVACWMAAADVFVLCSGGESGGNVVLEAMSSALPVISTPVGWASDLIEDGRNGLLFPTGDSSALESKLEKVLKKPELVDKLGKRARETILRERLTWQGCAGRYLELYRALLS